MERIHISTVLSQIAQSVTGNEPTFFSIGYVNAKGERRFREKVRKAGLNPEEGQKFWHNSRKHGTVPIYDEDLKEYREIKVGNITHYNGYPVKHK